MISSFLADYLSRQNIPSCGRNTRNTKRRSCHLEISHAILFCSLRAAILRHAFGWISHKFFSYSMQILLTKRKHRVGTKRECTSADALKGQSFIIYLRICWVALKDCLFLPERRVCSLILLSLTQFLCFIVQFSVSLAIIH